MNSRMIIVGIDHKSAPISVREKFYLNSVERKLFLSELKNDPAVITAIVLSTCNRTEVYAKVLCETSRDAADEIIHLLVKIKNDNEDSELQKYFYVHKEKDALEHLFRVTTGLESLVLGEKQILGQFKEAIEVTRDFGMMDKEFNILSNLVIRAGKKAQDETLIGYGGASVSWAAVTKATEILGTLKDKSVLIIGAGKMSKLAANNLANKGISQIYIMNRTQEKAESFARLFDGLVVPFSDVKEILSKVDLCICSAGCAHYLIDKDTIGKVMEERCNSGLLLIDISMPRNIDPKVEETKSVTLISIDDLDKAVCDNLNKRKKAIVDVENIIRSKREEFHQKMEKINLRENLIMNDDTKEYAAVED